MTPKRLESSAERFVMDAVKKSNHDCFSFSQRKKRAGLERISLSKLTLPIFQPRTVVM
jgi:hypothetical protein